MTIDWDKPIGTEDGLPARLISEDYRVDRSETVRVVQIEYHHKSVLRLFDPDGKPRYSYEGRVRNRKTKREGWINVYANTNTHGPIWGTAEEAKTFQTVSSITTIKIEWEE